MKKSASTHISITEYQKLHITAETCRKKIQFVKCESVRAYWFERLLVFLIDDNNYQNFEAKRSFIETFITQINDYLETNND